MPFAQPGHAVLSIPPLETSTTRGSSVTGEANTSVSFSPSPSAPLGPNIDSCAGGATRCFVKPPPGEFNDDAFGGYFHLCVNVTAPAASPHRYVMQQEVEAGSAAGINSTSQHPRGVRMPCKPGFFQDLAQQPTCKGCPSGYHADNVHALSCKQCPAGWYSLEEQAHCTGCPEVGCTRSCCLAVHHCK